MKKNTNTANSKIQTVLLSDVEKWAKRNQLYFNPAKIHAGEWVVNDCLPNSEADDLQEKLNAMTSEELENVTEQQELNMAMEYFDQWDRDYIAGFCNSISDRVILGKYLSEHTRGWVEIQK